MIIEFQEREYNKHLTAITTATEALAELINTYKHIAGDYPKDFNQFIQDPITYAGNEMTKDIVINGIDLSVEKKLFLKDINLKPIATAYEKAKHTAQEAELTLTDFSEDYKVKPDVLNEIKETYTIYASTKEEREFTKHLQSVIKSLTTAQQYLSSKGLTANVGMYLMPTTNGNGLKVNTNAFKIASRTLNRS